LNQLFLSAISTIIPIGLTELPTSSPSNQLFIQLQFEQLFQLPTSSPLFEPTFHPTALLIIKLTGLTELPTSSPSFEPTFIYLLTNSFKTYVG